MGKVFEGIDAKLADWIGRQRMFFVGTAPADGGHVNVSPKGPIESLRILGPTRVAYLDLIGSRRGDDRPPAGERPDLRDAVRLRRPAADRAPARPGHGAAAGGRRRTPELYGGFDVPESFAVEPGARSVIAVEVDRVADSCGYGVPLMTYQGERPQQAAWVERKLRQDGTAALDRYVAEKNARSIDGLPAIDQADAVRRVT